MRLPRGGQNVLGVTGSLARSAEEFPPITISCSWRIPPPIFPGLFAVVYRPQSTNHRNFRHIGDEWLFDFHGPPPDK